MLTPRELCDETTILQGGQFQYVAAMVSSSSNSWVLPSVMNNCRSAIKDLKAWVWVFLMMLEQAC